MKDAERKSLHFKQHFRLLTAMYMVVSVSACVPERDNPGDPFGINPKQYDGGSDVAIDNSRAEASVDMARVDAVVDQAVPDIAVDQAVPDIGIDMALPDVSIDLPLPDAATDMGLDIAIDSTQVVVPDGTPDVPPMDGPRILKLVNGGVSSVGPTSTGTLKYRLLESGFELEDRVCSAMYCITGGITP